MYCRIDLIPKMPVDNNNVEELLWSFLCSLERNGQILKDYKIVKNENYFLFVTFPKEDSFDEKYDGVYVERERKRIKEYFDYSVIALGENIESQLYCCCSNRSGVEMQTYNWDIDSVFTCLDCGKPIAMYELPFLNDHEDHFAIQDWQENYSAIHMLWTNCLCDRYTGNQLVKPDSALNKQGYEIAQEMSKLLGCNVYYHLSDEYGRKIKTEYNGESIVHVCPKCQKAMKRVNFTEGYIRDICDDCGLSFDAH